MTHQQSRQHGVFVDDDEPVLRRVASQAFEDAGCTTYEAGRADKALDGLEEHSDISVLFTDIDIPGAQDGLALAGAVHERRPESRLILTSRRERPAPTDMLDDGQ